MRECMVMFVVFYANGAMKKIVGTLKQKLGDVEKEKILPVSLFESWQSGWRTYPSIDSKQKIDAIYTHTYVHHILLSIWKRYALLVLETLNSWNHQPNNIDPDKGKYTYRRMTHAVSSMTAENDMG